VHGFTHIDNINDGISVYFLINLNASQSIELNVTHLSVGDFVLFLFDQRPTESFVGLDNTLDSRIFSAAINYSLDDNPYLFHVVSETTIYYIQLILLDNGPDTFFLNCDRDLTRYYLPLIPGYQIELIVMSVLLSIGVVMILKRNRIKT
jgi:hypothetical protein